MSHQLVEAMANMKEDEALRIVDELLAKGEDPGKILDLASEAMQVVGTRYQEGEYFLPELIMSGEMLRKIGEVLKPPHGRPDDGETKKLGTVVLGTVRGDIHDIGKDIVGFMLEVNGFTVHDLGIDQPEKKLSSKAVKEHKPQVLALSGFFSVAFDSMKTTVEQVEAAGLRPGPQDHHRWRPDGRHRAQVHWRRHLRRRCHGRGGLRQGSCGGEVGMADKAWTDMTAAEKRA